MSQGQLFIESFKRAKSVWWPLLRENWLILVVITGFVQLHTQYFLFLSKAPFLDDTIRILCQFGISASAMLESIFIFMLIPLRINDSLKKRAPTAFWPFFKKYIGPLTIEGIKMTALVILWLLAFIIPGLFKQVRWYFMPFVVMFEDDYMAGKIDPLDRSNELVRGATLIVFIITMVDFTLQLQADSWGLKYFMGPEWLNMILTGAITLMFSVFTCSWIYFIYLIQKENFKEVSHELTV